MAGNNATLRADGALQLDAQANTATKTSSNHSSSASVGLTASVGAKGMQLGVTVAGSLGRGHADGDDLTWTNTQVGAGNAATLQSGSDTTLKGAVVTAHRIDAEVGGTLQIQSLQDTSTYDSKQQSISGSATFGPASGGNLSASQSNVDSTYASVTEQTGLKAGDGGFNVQVQGKTDLQGGVISSTEVAVQAQRNSFASAELTTTDIQNHASFSANATGISVGAGVSTDGKLAPSGSGVGIGHDSGSDSSVTTAGISGIAGNTAVRTGDKPTGIAKIFDAASVERDINAQVIITQAFTREAGKSVNNYTNGQRKDLRKQLENATTDADKKALQLQINDLNREERVMNVLIGAVTGLGVAAVTKETLSAAADEMRQIMIEDSKKFAGVTDNKTTLSNSSGESEGVRGDGIKVGGTRIDLDLLCGSANERCSIQLGPDGKKILDENGKSQLILNSKGQVQFNPEAVGGLSLDEYLVTAEGKKMVGLTGGIQGAKGTLFGVPYAAGSWPDKLIEAFSGAHDMIGGKVSGLYDEQGNIKRGMTDRERAIYDKAITTSAIPLAAPFALAEALPPEVWKAISILLGIAK